MSFILGWLELISCFVFPSCFDSVSYFGAFFGFDSISYMHRNRKKNLAFLFSSYSLSGI